MANESRAFRLLPNVKLEDVVKSVENYCQIDKHMETQASPTTDGYILQASQAKDGWKTISGTRLAITVHFMLVNDVLNVTIGEGQWSDKIGAGAIGLFVAWPLAISAGFGAFQQRKLPAEIFAVVEKAIYTGGQQVVINGAGPVLQEGMILCPKCKTQNTSNSKFCLSCGSPLSADCPDCGFHLVPGARFCPGCGKKLD